MTGVEDMATTGAEDTGGIGTGDTTEEDNLLYIPEDARPFGPERPLLTIRYRQAG